MYDTLVFMHPLVVSQCGNQTPNLGSEATISDFQRHLVSTFEIGRYILNADVTSGTLSESAMYGTSIRSACHTSFPVPVETSYVETKSTVVGKPTVLAIESGEMQTTSAGAEDFMGENAD